MFKNNNKGKLFVRLIALIGVIIFAFYLARVAQESEFLRNAVADYGYIGILIIAFISGFNLFIPVPAVAFIPLFLESGLNFLIIISLVTLGVTLADSIAYWIGRLGHTIFFKLDSKVFNIIQNLREKYHRAPFIILFLFAAFMPLPNEILVIPLGAMKYSFKYIFLSVLAGNFLFNFLYTMGIIEIFNKFM